jgi:hypothetical protein
MARAGVGSTPWGKQHAYDLGRWIREAPLIAVAEADLNCAKLVAPELEPATSTIGWRPSRTFSEAN